MNGFQAAFAHSLLGRVEPQPAWSHPALAVHRNTVLKGCVDTLEANFPAVARLVGSDWFRAAAVAYARAHPPTDVRLFVYGDDGFGAFLQALASAASLPYLAGVARLDTLWRAVHVAADAPPLQAASLAAVAPEALAARVLRPHPATRWAWFDAVPVPSIWSRNRGDAPAPGELAWHGEGLLLTRVDGAVRWQPLARGGCDFLDACAAGLGLGHAAERAMTDPATDVATLLATLLQAGAFTDPA
ncbi:DNA-binding domain-containing protein [Ramlibacter sp. AN1133]|uniref:DNA-binding domain-containing protein n=1 Tax=Ramlibacter sp. AN1133 TaxID=3133429 RepID=UPI0030C414FC